MVINNAKVNSQRIAKVIPSLYYLIAFADGNVSEKEREMAIKMVEYEGIDLLDFEMKVSIISQGKTNNLFTDVVKELKLLTINEQVRCIAWMNLIANADSFMDQKEWGIIFKIFNKELRLDMKTIMADQANLHAQLYGLRPMSFGLKVNA